MLGNFTYHNPTKLIFGKDATEALTTELADFGPTVQLVYGGGSIKRNGIYGQVVAALAAAGKTVVEGTRFSAGAGDEAADWAAGLEL
ncbi:MAG: iron-containing alcohol dehydrogenase [Atopobiaceae bacterium]|nr:iron-containing alcohol dehydrogenase [Atopobiaceae bacterium]